MGDFSCDYCGKRFREARYLDTHMKKGKECRELRGVMFVCLRCGGFHTTKFGALQIHLETCKCDSRIVDVIEDYQSAISSFKEENNNLRQALETVQIEKTSRREPGPNIPPPIARPDVPETTADCLDVTFGTSDIEDFDKYFQEKYRELATKKTIQTSQISKLKRLRRVIFKKGDMEQYKKTLVICLSEFTIALEKKKVATRKIQRLIKTHFTPLDLRMLDYEGYEAISMDGSSLKELSLVLSCREAKHVYDTVNIVDRLLNCSMSFFPLSSLIERELYRKNTMNYVYMGETEPLPKIPFAFYKLVKINKNSKRWEMDCRMQEFITSSKYRLINYLVDIFRKYYYRVYSDNCYRENYLDKMVGLTEEMTQIMSNLKCLGDSKKYTNMCHRVVIKRNTYKKQSSDRLNLVNDDPIEDIENEDSTNHILSRIFDNISPEEMKTKLI